MRRFVPKRKKMLAEQRKSIQHLYNFFVVAAGIK